MRKLFLISSLLLANCNQARTPERGVDTTLPDVPGKIEGTLAYPADLAEFPELEACAEDPAGKVQACVAGYPSTQYELHLPPGTYFLFARRKLDPKVRAYYTDFIQCGSLDSCTSHAKIAVNLADSEEKTGIELGDWKDLPQAAENVATNMATGYAPDYEGSARTTDDPESVSTNSVSTDESGL